MNIALKRPAPASKEAVLFLYELYQEAKKILNFSLKENMRNDTEIVIISMTFA